METPPVVNPMTVLAATSAVVLEDVDTSSWLNPPVLVNRTACVPSAVVASVSVPSDWLVVVKNPSLDVVSEDKTGVVVLPFGSTQIKRGNST